MMWPVFMFDKYGYKKERGICQRKSDICSYGYSTVVGDKCEKISCIFCKYKSQEIAKDGE